MNERNKNKSLITLIIVIIAYSVLCLSLEQSGRLTADAMLYVRIAQNYLTGDFQNAINGYWGPLLAWLFVPFLYVGISDIFAVKLLNLIFGIVTLIGIWVLSFRFEMSRFVRNIVLIASLLIVLKFSLVQPMDFLLVSILVIYLGIVFKTDYYRNVTRGIYCGLFGSLAYFTKAYAFPFFIIHFFVINVFHYFANTSKEIRQKILVNTIAGFVLFFLISGLWIATISKKYGFLTFSTMRSTNFNAPGPDVKGEGREFGVPVFYEGFFPPPNETAFVVWEDPSYLRGNKWSPWQSARHFKHFIKLVLNNIAEGLRIFESFSTFSITIVMAYVFFIARELNKKVFLNSALLPPFFTLILFSGGYVLFHFEERYLWLSNILLILMGAYVVCRLIKSNFFASNLIKNILIFVFAFSFVFVPMRFIIQSKGGSTDSIMYELSQELKKYNIKGNLASNREPASHEAWHKTFRLAYWLNSKYYGQAGEGWTDETLKNELEKYKIDYYFVWGQCKEIPEFLRHLKEVTSGNIPELRIYALSSF